MGEVSVVDRTQDDAAFDSLANSPTIQTEWTRDSCANIFGNELASIIEGYAFIRGPVLSSRGRYPMISRALFYFPRIRVPDRSFLYPGYEKRDENSLLYFRSRTRASKPVR